MSGVKYHINPATGRPNQCNATVRGCKYAEDGKLPEHYDTKEEAQEAYEKQNKDKTFNNRLSKSSKNSGITDKDKEKFQEETEQLQHKIDVLGEQYERMHYNREVLGKILDSITTGREFDNNDAANLRMDVVEKMKSIELDIIALTNNIDVARAVNIKND